MTRHVITVRPDSSVKQAAEVMAELGFAALPVVDEDDMIVGIVAEADVLRDSFPPDPRLHLRRDEPGISPAPPRCVRGVMTVGVRSVEASADVADVARLFVEEHVRSVPVLEHGRTVGIVSRRDLLRTIARSDDTIRADVLGVVEDYTGDTGCWDVRVSEGNTTIRRTHRAAQVTTRVEEQALRELAATVPGVVSADILPSPAEGAASAGPVGSEVAS
jgi:CBS domain-containing protein